MISAHLRYAGYVVRHKWFVLRAGLRTGAPLWRLVIHDWSKLTPAEWGPYVRRFYGGRPGVPVTSDDAPDFMRAWLHHQHHNPHHWQPYVRVFGLNCEAWLNVENGPFPPSRFARTVGRLALLRNFRSATATHVPAADNTGTHYFVPIVRLILSGIGATTAKGMHAIRSHIAKPVGARPDEFVNGSSRPTEGDAPAVGRADTSSSPSTTPMGVVSENARPEAGPSSIAPSSSVGSRQTTASSVTTATVHAGTTATARMTCQLLRQDDGHLVCLACGRGDDLVAHFEVYEMPEHFVREMVADWMGASRAITGSWSAKRWYESGAGEAMDLHPATRALAEHLIATVSVSPERGE